MDVTNRSSLAPRDMCRILFRHKRKFAVVFTLTMGVVVVGLVTCPRRYVSEAKMLVRLGRQSVNLDPTATVGATVSVQESRENEIRSVVDVLQSRMMHEKVVKRLGPAVILAQSLDADDDSSGRSSFDLFGLVRAAAGILFPKDDVSDTEQAIRVLEDSVVIEAGKKSSVVSVVCLSESPALSQRIVQTYLDEYRNEHVEVNSTQSYEFFERQVAELQANLDKATSALSETKNKLGLTSIEGQREIVQTQINNLNRDIADADATLSAATARTEALRKFHPNLSDKDIGTSALSQTAIDQMRDTLYELQIREREMASKYQPQHPALLATVQQVREVEAILTRQELLIELANISTLTARIEAFQRRYAEALNKLQRLNQYEVEIADLERQVELLRTSYRTYAEKMEQARVVQALDAEQVTNLRIVQPASFVAKAVSPKAGVILFLGLFVSAFGGLGVALLCEFFDHSLQTPEQIEGQLDLPVLVSVPYCTRHGLALT